MWVEEVTVKTICLEKGRILILAPADKKIFEVVQVKVDYRVFPVRLEESSMQVSSEWLIQILGLNRGLNFGTSADLEPKEFSRDSEGRNVQSDKISLPRSLNLKEKAPSKKNGMVEKEEAPSQETFVAKTQFEVAGEVQMAEVKKSGRRGMESSTKTHPMKTRGSKKVI
ncbi:hypothetical protein Q3G72_000507 [Acer saccharum]|nr:hypothetical protein Q3G72_000507 [Acer saccharum]